MKSNTYLVSPACREIVGITSYDDLPVWAILEMAEARLLNVECVEENKAIVGMISAVRARLSKLSDEDTAQCNPVMKKSDWDAQEESE
jgi:hypothetical protein